MTAIPPTAPPTIAPVLDDLDPPAPMLLPGVIALALVVVLVGVLVVVTVDSGESAKLGKVGKKISYQSDVCSLYKSQYVREVAYRDSRVSPFTARGKDSDYKVVLSMRENIRGPWE